MGFELISVTRKNVADFVGLTHELVTSEKHNPFERDAWKMTPSQTEKRLRREVGCGSKYYVVSDSESKSHIGIAGISITPNSRLGKLGMILHEDRWSKGIGKRVTEQLVKVAKDNGLQRLEALTFNPAMAAILRKNGFKRQQGRNGSYSLKINTTSQKTQ